MLLAVIIGLAAVLVAATRWRHGSFDWALFTSTLWAVRWPWLAVAVLIAMASYYGRVLRWAVMIRHLRPHPDLGGLFSATIIGFTAIYLFGRPGEFVRPYLIAIKEKVSVSSQLAAWLLERICDLLTTLLIFAFALAEVERSGAGVGPRLRWAMETGGYLLGGVGLLSLAVVILLRQFPSQFRQRLIDGLEVLPVRWRTKAAELVDSFLNGLEATRSPAGLWGLVWYTVLEWALIISCYFAMFRAFPATSRLGFGDALILIGFVAFGSLVQIPGLGGGVQVVCIVILSEVFKLPVEAATGIALIIWLITFVVVVPVGVVYIVKEGLNWRKIKEIEESCQP